MTTEASNKEKFLAELLEQAPRLATFSVMMCTVVASTHEDRGPALADALAGSLAQVAALPFLLSWCSSSFQQRSPGPMSQLLYTRRRSLDVAVATLFAVHLLAHLAVALLTGTPPELPYAVAALLGYLAIFVRPALSEKVRRRRGLYDATGYYVWFLYVGAAVCDAAGIQAEAPSPLRLLIFLGVFGAALVFNLRESVFPGKQR